MSYWKKIVEFLIGGSGDRARDSKGRFVQKLIVSVVGSFTLILSCVI